MPSNQPTDRTLRNSHTRLGPFILVCCSTDLVWSVVGSSAPFGMCGPHVLACADILPQFCCVYVSAPSSAPSHILSLDAACGIT